MELTEALWCDIYHLAPESGALDDQDIVRMARYDTLRSIYRVCVRYNQGGQKGMSRSEQQVWAEILDLEWERDHA